MESPIKSVYVIPGIERQVLSPERVIFDICQYYEVDESMVLAPRSKSGAKRREYTKPRQVAMYAIKELFPRMTLMSIAKIFGGRDHATVIHSTRLVKDQVDIDGHFAIELKEVMEMLNIKLKCNTTNEVHKQV